MQYFCAGAVSLTLVQKVEVGSNFNLLKIHLVHQRLVQLVDDRKSHFLLLYQIIELS